MDETLRLLIFIYFLGFFISGEIFAVNSAWERPHSSALDNGILAIAVGIFWPLFAIALFFGCLGKIIAFLLKLGTEL